DRPAQLSLLSSDLSVPLRDHAGSILPKLWRVSNMAKGRPLELQQELVEAFRQSGLVNEYLVNILPTALWRMNPPSGGGRSIAAIAAHMQSVRRMFARMGGVRPGPASLDRKNSTPREAQRALHQSTEDLARLFETAFLAHQARVKGMPRRAVNMLTYLI